ncbi:Endo-1,4-beta-xylanase A [Hypsizygus marmoreus]|uniref:Endo-1,4-beta-xylanase A n=1 Tax=Hypsizygus marmoreus TaxID=39966 RepID=A0A369JBE1_HYPMA|nr:Endo-1,4-beta-xylanase A [Hypsizygus marmoreus]
MRSLLTFILLSFSASTLAIREYLISNRCPTEIPLYISGELQGNLAVGELFTKTYPGAENAFIYTSANGGSVESGRGLTRAGFFADDDYYYIIVDPVYFNVGIQITPLNSPPAGTTGFCGRIACTTLTCATAFQQAPTSFPAPTSTPPAPPLYACPTTTDTRYLIEFCPGGTFPSPTLTTVALNPNGNKSKCADVRGAAFANGTPVQIYDCNNTPAQKWTISRGSTKVQLTGTNFCLDAGSTPGNGIGMKIWTCYDNLPAQAWYFTDDNRIALEGKGLCLDLPNGVLTNSNQLQTWQCTDNNNNQVWTI